MEYQKEQCDEEVVREWFLVILVHLRVHSVDTTHAHKRGQGPSLSLAFSFSLVLYLILVFFSLFLSLSLSTYNGHTYSFNS